MDKIEGVDWPELPEGYFFRVYRSALGIYPYVSLRKEVKLFGRRVGSYKVEERCQWHTEFPTVKSEVEYLARVLVDWLSERGRVEREFIEGDSR